LIDFFGFGDGLSCGTGDGFFVSVQWGKKGRVVGLVGGRGKSGGRGRGRGVVRCFSICSFNDSMSVYPVKSFNR
jgi:hypothetical protein